jgi:glyoxylase-like metal-dependent hydrolase (beta-lactamase superfamily II)/8-oxo-dGTP pyrophosphatase MutT (NUDIX family)
METERIDTAGLLLTHGSGADFRLLWARRPAESEPLGGFWSFVVGRVEAIDAESPVDGSTTGLGGIRYASCALRELFEEFGLLALSDGLIRDWRNDEPSPFGDWRDYRTQLRGDAAHFASDLREAELSLQTSRLRHMGGWSTPEWMPGSFQTEFFQLHLSNDEMEELDLVDLPRRADRREMARAEWISPADALNRWAEGEAMLTTPLRLLIEHLDDERGPIDEAQLAERGRGCDPDGAIEIIRGISLLPMPTVTLPPATHTNAYILGQHELLVIDPGSGKNETLRPLFDELDARLEAGAVMRAVVLTHHHSDHVGGVTAIRDRYDCEVWAHEATAERLHDERADRLLRDGETHDLSPEEDDEIVFLHTPGHAPGHLSILHRRSHSMLVGDLVASEGTIVIDPPDGHMGSYMESLERVRDLEPRQLLPAHGMPIANPLERLQFYLDHRMARERSVLEALEQNDAKMRPIDLVPHVYDEVPKHLWPLAARSLEAHLIHLVEEEYAHSDGELYWPNCRGDWR